jgi:hypothetical protein
MSTSNVLRVRCVVNSFMRSNLEVNEHGRRDDGIGARPTDDFNRHLAKFLPKAEYLGSLCWKEKKGRRCVVRSCKRWQAILQTERAQLMQRLCGSARIEGQVFERH